ncbi:MAG: TIGR03545 family protein [Gammaproteobacteria bacterium]|nr:TIGR03545 family protein [Gammaproteobacteria bacterium]MCF6230789.1 TIGR03545 family protein [Gammaproteobacteria bacterium]
MRSIFRPKGVIAFALVVTLIFLFWWLLADWLLKQGVEKSGSALLQTQVELKSAQLQLSPLGFKLNGLQITNPDDPMQNIVSAATISGYIQLMPLLMGQVVITELKAHALQLNTPRTTPGIIPKKTIKETEEAARVATEKEGFGKRLAASLPSVDELIERLPITTIKLAKAFDSDTQQAFETLEQQISTLPDQTILKDYEKRLKAITEGEVNSPQDLAQRISELKQLKTELKENKQTLTKIRDNIRDTQQQLSSQWKTLKEAPAADLTLLKNSYGLSSDNLGNISGLLFGDKVQYWVTKVEPYLKQAQRLIPSGESTPPPPPRGEGRLIHFVTENPRPDFLIQRAAIDMTLPIGELTLVANNITHQPAMLGSPTTVQITGQNLKQIASINIEGVFDYRSHEQGFSKISGTAQQWQLDSIELSKNNKHPIIISKAMQTVEGELLFKSRELQADIDSRYTQVNWTQSERPSTLQKVLGNIENFDLQVSLSGSLTSPKTKLRSNLDKQLGAAFKQQLRQQQSILKEKLSSRLSSEIEQRAGRYSEQLGTLNLQQDSLNQSLEKLEEMLKSEIKSGLDEKKGELKDKLKDKLRDKLKF